MVKGNTVISPNYGLVLDKPPIALNGQSLQDGFNFRVSKAKLSNLNLGWDRFESGITLNGAVLLIANFLKRDGTEKLIFTTKTDIYQYRPATHDVRFITPSYVTGTVTVAATAVTGAGTLWNTGNPTNAKAGDQIAFTTNAETDPAAAWFTIQSVNSDTSITLTGSAGVVGAGHQYTIRKLRTGDEGNVWVDRTFVNAGPANEDQWWATNGGIQPPVSWNGVTTFAVSQDALGFTCKYLTVYSNMMIFANLVQGGTAKPTDIINSNVGEPANVTSGLSEQFKVHGGFDVIQALKVLGDSLAIYSELTVTVAQFVGDPLIFVFRNAMTGVGLIAPKAVADFGNFHQFLYLDSQYFFDGATVKEINMHMWREMIRQQDPTRRARAYSHFDEESGDLVWSLPATTDPGAGTETSPPARAISAHYLEDVPEAFGMPHSLRAFPFTSTGYFTKKNGTTWDTLTLDWSQYNFRWNDQFFFTAFPLNMAGSNDGKLYTFGTSQDADGVALPSFVRFGRRAVIDGRARGLVKRIYPFVTQLNNTLKVTLRMLDSAMGAVAITNVDLFDQTQPQEGHFVTPYRRGRYMDIQFGTDGPQEPWELSGYDVDIVPGGKR